MRFILSSIFLFCAIFPAFPSYARNESEENSAWIEVLQTKGKELKEQISLLEFFEDKVSKECKALDDLYSKTEERNYQIKFVLLSNSSPYHFRMVRREHNRNIAEFIRQISIVRNLAKTNEMYSGILKEMYRYLKPLEENEGKNPESRYADELFKTVSSISDRLDKTGLELNSSLEPALKLQAQLISDSDELDSTLPERMMFYFFKRKDKLVIFKSWVIVFNDLLVRSKDIPLILQERLPSSLEGLKAVIVALVLVGISIFIAGRWCITNVCAKPWAACKSRHQSLLLFRALFFAILSLLLGLLEGYVNFPGNIAISRLSVIFGVMAWMDFSWSLARFRYCEMDLSFNSPFMPIFLVYSINLIYQVLDISDLSLALIWPLTLLLFVEPLLGASRKRLPFQESSLSAGIFWLALVLIALSLWGYLFLSIASISVLLTLSLSLQTASNLSFFSKKLMMKVQRIVKNGVLKALLLGLAVPVIWGGILLLSAIWLSDQLVNPVALFRLMSLDFVVFGATFNLMKLLSGLFLFFVFKTVINVMQDLSPQSETNPLEIRTLHSIRSILEFVLWSVYCFILLHMLGVSMTSITVIAGGLSVGIGFGLQNIVNNFISGVLIVFGRTVRQGDMIQIDGTLAKVLDINVRSTTVQTMENAIISVPNSDILTSKIINWTRNNPIVKREIKVGVAYGSDIEKVKNVLEKIADRHDHVLKDPRPLVLFKEFGDSTLCFSLFVWIAHIDDSMKTLSDLHYEINRQFRAEKITIAFPQLEILMKTPEDK